ncbi:MAG TPA: hypothetical protein VG205_03755 [Acidimicrobiales bacterium]|jgi:hypothetical protein|nr:hypothetical protein [Acidimicrobiales bacterium]
MATLQAHGIEARLPSGFEGRIFIRPRVADEITYPVAHFASFPLPNGVGDFGSGAVTTMGPNDIFAVLFEYGPESVGTALFSRQGMPRSLGVNDFRPNLLRRGIGGQSGTQWFFTESQRPFTFYAVLGSHVRRSALVPQVNALLSNLAVSPQPPTVVPGTVPWN